MVIRHRRAILNDAPKLLELRSISIRELAPVGPSGISIEESVKWAGARNLAEIEQRIREMEVWVAEIDSGIVGWVAIRGDYLAGMYTDPAHAGNGIGTDMLGLTEGIMRDQGIEIIRLESSRNAEGFYHRRGYRLDGQRSQDGAIPMTKGLT